MKIQASIPSHVTVPSATNPANAITSGIDMETGRILAGKEIALSREEDGYPALKPGTFGETLNQTINEVIAYSIDYMTQCQNSDSYSVTVKVFAVTLKNGEDLFGVWAGAPGDIGNSRLVVLDSRANVLQTVDENAELAPAQQKTVDQVKAAVDLVTGALAKGTQALKISYDKDGYAFVRAGEDDSTLSRMLGACVDNTRGAMSVQGSDPFSTVSVAFRVETADGPAYGVWAGAPGDIGNARLMVIDSLGRLMATIDE